ncbi:phospho-acceptor domain-containing protein [Edaphobacter modestus]|uniref:histidine kinase n=2 Tax=Edaphobacter modestus TaxID=388466 RepID=A0A4Q7YQC8_9BACT|nr:phospho-acceptor domain-containing protein [Edaphobacter modestus]
MLVFMLGVMLPAAGFIVAGASYLRNIQRNKAIEAVIQREHQQVLAIAEKRIDARAYDIAEEARAKFPDVNQGDRLEAFLVAHPDIAHAVLWAGKGHVQGQSQPARMNEPAFGEEGKEFSSMIGHWFDPESESKDWIAKLKKMEAKEGKHVYLTDNWVSRGDKWQYQSLVLFVPRGSTAEHPALAGFVYDTDYLKDKFFPQALNDVLPNQNQNDTHPQPVIMVRTVKDHAPLATSLRWDGGSPEVERSFEGVFPGLVLGIKLRGTTIANISNHFVQTAFLILGALSLLMGGGMLLTYRNVARELALAKLKSDFVSNVSHELRTPLALIRLYAETLELGRISNPGKRQEYYEIIRKESERLTSLINNILDFSRIESGKKEYSFRETDVADLVRSTLESYRFEIEQDGFQFEQKIDNDLPQVWVDREAIARSLLNLVNNAVKYSATEKYLGVNLYRHNGGVNLEVVDHGIGISAKEQPKIFEKFYRVGDPLVHNTKGSGLGLSLVRHIVQAHGGEVAVESEPGQGSKFIITLPVQTAEVQQAKGMSA